MKIHLISPALPPALDGIGDYTAKLSAELVKFDRVKVLCSTEKVGDAPAGVTVEPAFSVRRRRSVMRIADVVAADRPDWVVLQFNQFSYGRWGLNPFLPVALRAALRRSPATRLAVMFHEDFVPAINWKFALMRQWQRWQFRALGQAADVVFFSIEPWVRKYSGWFGDKPVLHLPVGSNIPQQPIAREAARAELGIAANTVVFGLFGSGHSREMLGRVQLAVCRAGEAGIDAILLYVGIHGEAVRAAMRDVVVRDEGPLPVPEVSKRLCAMDVYLAPFVDGVSTRRGSMMAGLEHGLAAVGTLGPHTDPVLRVEHDRAMLLAPVESEEEYAACAVRLARDAHLRDRFGRAARELYQREFAWPMIAARLLEGLGRVSEIRPQPTPAAAPADLATA